MPEWLEIVATPEGTAPVYEPGWIEIGAVVHACHERSIDEGLAQLAAPDLDRSRLEDVLTYCAELRCEAAGATCQGCRRRSMALGLETIDDFVRMHRDITLGTGDVRLQGPGNRTAVFESLNALEKAWAGEAYWYWARRVLRKLRHGVRRAWIKGEAFADEGQTPAVILMEPQLADNIGMVARGMANFGLDALRLVNPRDGWPNEKARVAASGANFVIDDAVAVDTLAEGIKDLNWVCATTARQRDLAKPVLTPRQAVEEIGERIARGERCGVLFGRERNGLETDEVAVCDAVVMVPVNPRFASLNLAQAVLLMGYEWLQQSDKGTLGRVTSYEKALAPGVPDRGSPPASKEDLLGLFAHLEGELERLGFFNPPHKRQTVVRNVRTMLMRMQASKQEVQTLRGIVATLSHGKGIGRKPP